MDDETQRLLILLFGLLLGIVCMLGHASPCTDNEHACGTTFEGEKITTNK